ncbi:MAG: porin [Anaerolineales bacterium]
MKHLHRNKNTVKMLGLAATVALLNGQTANAQQGSSSVQLYGIVDAAMTSATTGGAAGVRNMRVDSGVYRSSYWGFRGSEDLGGGLKAIFNLEAGFESDTGAATAYAGNPGFVGTAPAPSIPMGFNRRSFVGVQGNYGTLKLGRDYTAGYYAQQATDALGFHMWGNAQSAADLTGTGGERSGRVSNAIFYDAPNLAGVRIRAAYSLGAESGGGTGSAPKDANKYWGIGAGYVVDKLTLTAAYAELSLATLAGTPAAFTGSTDKRKDVLLGAKYNFDNVSVSGGYASFDQSGPSNTGKQYWLGGSAKVGTGTLYAQVQKLTREVAAGTEPRATVLAVAYSYPFSRRTLAYASYGKTRNNAAGNFRLYSSGSAIAGSALGASPQALSVGINHTF